MRTWCVAVIALVLLISPTSAVAAPMNKEEIPATFVTGTVIDDTAMEDEGRVVYEQTVDWSDPRLPPTLRVEAAWYVYGDVAAALERLDAGESEDDAFASGVVMVLEMNALLDGADGSWQGTGRAVEDEGDRYSQYELFGEGVYEGLFAVLRTTPGRDTHGPWEHSYEGYIFEADPLPFPEPPEPTTSAGTKVFPYPTEPPAE